MSTDFLVVQKDYKYLSRFLLLSNERQLGTASFSFPKPSLSRLTHNFTGCRRLLIRRGCFRTSCAFIRYFRLLFLRIEQIDIKTKRHELSHKNVERFWNA